MSVHSDICKKLRTPWQRRIERLKSYLVGTQYEGRPHFLDQSDPSPPLLERAPCVVYPVTANAIRSHQNMLLGDKRAPKIALNGDSAPIAALDKESRFSDAIKCMLHDALAYADSFVVCSIDKAGRYRVEHICPSKVYATQSNELGTLTAIEIRYPYVTQVKTPDGEYVDKVMLCRRIIDTVADTVFFDVEAPPHPMSPINWRVNAALSVAHDLGFCPVVRWQRDRSIHEDYLDEIDALNRVLSQRHRAALYAGDPQIWETGVAPSDQQDTGRPALWPDGRVDHGEKKYVTYSTGPARKKGVSTVWSSANENASFGMLTLPGDALKSIDDECARLKSLLCESFAYVDIDLSQTGLASDASGKALEILHKRQIDFDSGLREELERCAFTPVILMLLLLGGLLVDESEISFSWGPWFEPTAHDANAAVMAASAALTAGIITREQASLYVLRFFGIDEGPTP